ncbi:MAG: hypothetical protein DCF22_02140 [Leptolyngbya sp.]|nr:MAG: hypothetical protein DCF22_02140 [Leptolyngbya sp.]
MDYAERQKKIVEYLRIKSTSHGQIYTFQMAVPPSTPIKVDSERFEAIKHSLTQQETNLISLIVRRTEAYSEEEEYEVVYGVDWYLVAKEIGIEKLWVWVFNMTDEEAQIARQEMELLAGGSNVLTTDSTKDAGKYEEFNDDNLKDNLSNQLSDMSRKIELFFNRFEESIDRKLDNKLGELFSKVEKIEAAIEDQLQEKTEVVLPKQVICLEQSSYSKEKLNLMSISNLKPIAKGKGLKGYSNWRKDKLIDAIINACE